MEVRADVLLTILGMALVTYLTRAGGLWLMGRIKPTRRIEAWLKHIPGAVLISLIAPAALTNGPAEMAGTALTVLVAWRSGNLLLAMVTGIFSVWLLRLVV